MVYHQQEGFFTTITETYGYVITKKLKSWIRINIMICTAIQQLTFLLRCRHSDVLPPHIYNLRFHINFTSVNVKHKYNSFKNRYQKKLLTLEIKDINCKLKLLKKKIKEIEESLFLELPEALVVNFFKFNENKIINHNIKIKNKLIMKFNSISRKCNPFEDNDYSKWIINISSKQIPDDVLRVLSLGDRFGLPLEVNDRRDRVDSVLQVIKNFELNIQKISEEAANETRGSLVGLLLNYLTMNRHTNYIEKHILKLFHKCRSFLKKNSDVFVTNADKGQVTVVMDKSTYLEKMTDLLSDSDTYKILKKDPLNRITNKFSDLIKSWRDGKLIDEYTYILLRCTNGILPRCYGLPKVHKPGFPLRIIVSTIGSPTYNVAKFLCEILQKSVQKPKSHIKDSWTFVRKIRNIKITPDQSLVSFDATALFTNIPKELALKSIERRWDNIATNTKFSLHQFLYAIDLILSSTSFVFDSRFYEQIFGSPMGSPLSPILADMVLDDLETHCLQLIDTTLPAFFRYVDDIFAIVPTCKINQILDIFNSYHPRLKFTCEIEKNMSIDFLDTTVIRNDENLLTNWFRKPTFSGRYINFYSNHPLKYKTNIITNLVDRAILLSDERFHDSNISIVKDILSNNCFPTHIIERFIKKRLREIKYSDVTSPLNNNREKNDFLLNKHIVTVPYIRDISNNIQNILNDRGFYTIFTIPKKLNCIIKRGKDSLDKFNQKELIYRIECNDCEACYVGQTKRHLKTRIKEHETNIKRDPSAHSVVSKHRESLHHDFNWLNTRILHTEKHTRKREIAEMVLIKKENNSINLQNDTENLSKIYDKIIRIL
jgi:hypothetical protein